MAGDSVSHGERHQLPSESERMALLKVVTKSVSDAMDALYTRTMNANSLLETAGRRVLQPEQRSAATSRLAKFILIASFVASFNPVTSDVRMFSRATEGRGRRKKAGPRRSKNTTVAKVQDRVRFALRKFADMSTL
jgi:origin recognition complex subunit 5